MTRRAGATAVLVLGLGVLGGCTWDDDDDSDNAHSTSAGPGVDVACAEMPQRLGVLPTVGDTRVEVTCLRPTGRRHE